MTTLLLIDTSPRKDAVSRELTNRFVEAWSAQHPDSTIIHPRALFRDPPRYPSGRPEPLGDAPPRKIRA